MTIPEVKAVAWDIDGTLVDSEPLHDEILVSTCAGFGVDLGDLPADAFLGVHANDVWLALEGRLSGRTGRESWMGALVDAYVRRSVELKGFPDALAVMRSLADRGVRQVCVSNSGRRVVDANLAAIGVDGIIEFSISLDDVARGKPDPEPYATAAKRLGLAPAEMVAVEDSPTGARAAHEAGMRVFGIGPSPVPLAEATAPTREALLPLLVAAAGGPNPTPRNAAAGGGADGRPAWYRDVHAAIDNPGPARGG
jgi:beta-phosphoglucomutase-like phosphatase (HAD superfamily)